MKKYLFAALGAGLLMTSCQSDEPLAPGNGLEQQVAFTVSLPDAVSTRAGGTNSAAGGVSNNVGTNVTFNVALYLIGGSETVPVYTASDVVSSTGNHTSATFEPTLVIGEQYRVVAYAKFDADTLNGELTAINVTPEINNEQKDEYFANTIVTAAPELSATLKRPFGKLRLIAEDLHEAERQYGAEIANVEVTYQYTRPAVFNAYAPLSATDNVYGVFGEYDVATAQTLTAAYGEYEADTNDLRTIFVDYLPVDLGEQMVPFTVKVTFSNGREYTRDFRQDIPVKRNWLTTLKGRLFTIDSDLTLTIEEGFEGETEINFATDLEWVAANGGTVNLTEDITLTKALNVTKDMVINLNGHTISAANEKGDGAVIEVAEGVSAKLVGGTIKNTTPNGDAAINNAGELVLENITIEGAPLADGGYSAYAVISSGKLTIGEGVNVSADRGCLKFSGAGETVINGGNFTNNDIGSRNLTSHVVDVENGGTHKLTINGGTFAHLHTATSGGVVICNRTKGTVYVNGGNFSGGNYYGNDNLSDYGYGGTFVVTGGTYSAKPAAKYIAAGYKAVENGGKYYVFPEASAIATTESEFKEALANSGNVVLLSNINIDKIDLTSVTSDVVIDANGYTITTSDSYGIQVKAGKNITIKNAEIEITKDGDYITYAAGLKIENGDYAGKTIKLENCEIRMHNTDWAYAVNMPASVKNLKLVLDECVLEGAIAVQCWGDNNTIEITNSKLICNYTTSAQYTSYCVALQGDGTYNSDNNKLTIANCEFLYTGIDNFDSPIYAVYVSNKTTGNDVNVSNCAYGEKIVQ